MSIKFEPAMKPGLDVVDEHSRIVKITGPIGADWWAKVPDFATTEIERLQACERALEIAETALRELAQTGACRRAGGVLNAIGATADEALTAIAAAKAGTGS